MTQVPANGILLEVEVIRPHADAAPPAPAAPVLLIMGLGMQLTAWPEDFVQGLLATGRPVIRFDNRDIGLSSKLGAWGRPSLIATMLGSALGLPVRAAYTLADMANDTAAMLEAIGVERAHVVGVSMGGMIGQLLAARHPAKVASFTCVMSSSGSRRLPGPTPAARRVLLARPDPRDRDAMVEHFVRVQRTIGSPGYPTPEAKVRERARVGVDRSVHPLGFVRQLAAIAASGDRSAELRAIRAPTTVVHGRDDPLVPVAAAHDLARRIPGARLCVIDGMGHDLAPGLVPALVGIVGETIRRGGGR